MSKSFRLTETGMLDPDSKKFISACENLVDNLKIVKGFPMEARDTAWEMLISDHPISLEHTINFLRDRADHYTCLAEELEELSL